MGMGYVCVSVYVYVTLHAHDSLTYLWYQLIS